MAKLFYLLAVAVCVSLVSCEYQKDGVVNNCDIISLENPFPYCITKTPGSTNPDIVYYFHGAGGNERRWVDRWKGIRDSWIKSGSQAPTIVSFSFGPLWFLLEKNSLKTSGLLELMLNKLIPDMEVKLGGLHGRRIIMGESMGGFNVAQLVMQSPESFNRAAILCPVITLHTPFATIPEIESFISRTGANRKNAYEEIAFYRAFFPDLASWNKAAPLIMGQTKFGPRTPPIYMSADDHDEFGFFEGDVALGQLIASKNVPIEWHTIVGGTHCTADFDSVARFLVSE